MSDTMESVKSGDDLSSVVIVTPPESTVDTTAVEPKNFSEKDDSDEKKKDDDEKDGDDDEKDDDEKKEKVMVGLVCDTKDLYAKYDENGARSWTEKLPSDLEEAAENEDTQKYAVIIRKSK